MDLLYWKFSSTSIFTLKMETLTFVKTYFIGYVNKLCILILITKSKSKIKNLKNVFVLAVLLLIVIRRDSFDSDRY